MEAFKKDPKYKKKSKYTILEKIEARKPLGLVSMKTISPTLVNGKFKIDFKGLAKLPSNKNFILNYGENKISCLILAKQRENTFLM